MLFGFIFILIGGAMIETPIMGYLNGEMGIAAVIGGLVFGALFMVPGFLLFIMGAQDFVKGRDKKYIDELLWILTPGFKEPKSKSRFDDALVSFRKHYSEFFNKERTSENEKIQQDITQVFRNIIQLQKNRLSRLGLTCEMIIKRMSYIQDSGVSYHEYSDGKYKITDIKEEVAAQTIYKKDGKEIYKKIDKDTANYTMIEARQVGADRIICPNCGADTTREALLDGCDYCGTKFTVEDLGNRIAVFAFRPDYKLRYEKYKMIRNKTIVLTIAGLVLAVFAAFSIYSITIFPDMMRDSGGGFILTLLANILAIAIASPIYILSFIIVYFGYAFAIFLLLAGIFYLIARAARNIEDVPMLDRAQEDEIRKVDPLFSIANFYSGLQNKISAVLYAENVSQLETYASGDISSVLGRYQNVVGMDVENMMITDFSTDDKMQYAGVDLALYLTRYTGKKCHVRKEYMHVDLEKELDCKTQVVCAPAIMTCKGCGGSLNLLEGKRCPHCGKELDLVHYDWAIRELKPDIPPYLKFDKKRRKKSRILKKKLRAKK